MSIYPPAEYRPLAIRQSQAVLKPMVIILHTMVGNLTGTDRMFKANGWSGTESHFGIGGPWGDGRDGVVYQWQDTSFRADANLGGNHRAISIETGDNAPARAGDIEPWTPKQVSALIDLVAWLCAEHDIPAVLMPDSKPERRGIGYHRLGVDPWRLPGGELWSTSMGKECPGVRRIAQIPGIVGAVRLKLTREVPAMIDQKDVDAIAAAVWAMSRKLTAADAEAMGAGTVAGKPSAMNALLRFPPAVERLRREQTEQYTNLMRAITGLTSAVTGLTSAVAQITKPTTGQ